MKHLTSSRLAWWIVVLGTPVLAWFSARMFVPEPRLVAPFLFVSPLIALGVAGAIIGPILHAKEMAKEHLGRENKERGPDRDTRFLAKKFAAAAGIDDYEIKVMDLESVSPRDAAAASAREMWLYGNYWDRLDAAGQEFAMARAFAQMDVKRNEGPWKFLGFMTGAYVGSVLGMINLWLIIPAQAVLATSFLVAVITAGKREPLLIDAKALAWTRNLEAALEYVASSTPKNGGFFSDRKTRVASLRQHAKALGIESA
jgi:hypothetical protein